MTYKKTRLAPAFRRTPRDVCGSPIEGVQGLNQDCVLRLRRVKLQNQR